MTSQKKSQLIPPHGGKLIDLLVDEKRAVVLKDILLDLPEIILNDRQLCDLELLANGTFSPLTGFMCRSDYESVLDRMRLQNDVFWPLPVCLDVTQVQAKSLDIGQSVTLRDSEGFLLAVLHIEELWLIDKEKEAELVYGSVDQNHHGVNYLFRTAGDYYVGGKLEVLSLPIHYDSRQLRNTPQEIRSSFDKFKWERIIGFQTRNPIHRPQYEVTIQAMRDAKANLLILPVEGTTRPGDFDHFTRIRCYRAITSHYPPGSYVLNLLPLSVRMSAARDKLLQMIIIRNYGCTHFIVERRQPDSSSNSNDNQSDRNDYDLRLLEDWCEELDLNLVASEKLVYLPFEDEYRPESRIPEGAQTISLSATDIHTRIRAGKKIPQWATFPEVIEELQKSNPPPGKQGLTLFFTGLSGAGKSTIAKVLYSRFQEIGSRPVTLLDGDIVRQNLSSQLSFSKEHRDINVRRIGFVACEITKNRGIAICAPIAPYSATRQEIRNSIEAYGGFIEVHVSTPLEECERRDRKGMYAKARAGLIKDFTGIDDPYEVPEEPELRIDTSNMSPDEAAQEVLLYLSQKGYIQ